MALPLERFLMLYCFPVQLLIGLAGNGLNLLVLTNRRMRSKTNWLLAMVALADSLFLLAFLPHSLLFNHWALRGHPRLRHFIFYANNNITACVNAFAFASAWFVVAVSLERMMAIRWPLHARRLWSCANLRRLILVIWAFALATSAHFHFTHSIRWTVRNETSRDPQSGQIQVEKRIALQSSIRPGWERLWGWLTAFSVLVGVLLPVLFVLLANLSILEALGRERGRRRQKRPGEVMENGRQQRVVVVDANANPPPPPPQPASPSSALFLLPLPSSAQLRHQRRATLAVLVIAGTFTLCQAPSALVHLWEVCWPPVGQLDAFRTAAVLSNFMIVTGKTANHFLLCLWSGHFRQNVRLVLGQLLPRWACPNCPPSVAKKSPMSLDGGARKGGPRRNHSLEGPKRVKAVRGGGEVMARRIGSLPTTKMEEGKEEEEEEEKEEEEGRHTLLTIEGRPIH